MILVDFSGTLARHHQAVRRLFEEIDYPFFKEHGFGGGEEELRSVFREVNRQIRTGEVGQGDFTLAVAGKLGIDVERDEAVEKEQEFDRRYAEVIEPVEGGLEGLRKLVKLDKLVLVTNGACRRVIPAVERLDMAGFFEQIICLGGTGQTKSEGEMFQRLHKMGAWAIIGDNPRKDGAAEEYGISFIDVRVGWETAVRLVRGLKGDRMRFRA
jgi:FMN phosphatase YigB (HAD superfamily)